MSTLIYIETSVPSFYYETRPSRDLQSRRDWTRQWWAMPRFDEEWVIGLPVISGLVQTPPPKRDKVPRTHRSTSPFALHSRNRRNCRSVFCPYANAARRTMRRRSSGACDFSQLRCDILVTWTCKHLANANKFGHIHRVNALLGLRTPALVTHSIAGEKRRKRTMLTGLSGCAKSGAIWPRNLGTTRERQPLTTRNCSGKTPTAFTAASLKQRQNERTPKALASR
jgi:hypothetical protein